MAWPRPTRRGLVLLIAAVVLVVVGAFAGFSDVMRAGIFALLLVVMAALVLVVLRPGGLEVHRRGPSHRMEAGRPSTVILTATPRRRIEALDAHVVEPHTFSPGGQARWSLSDLLDASATYDVEPPHRGAYTSGPTVLELRDPLGLMKVRTTEGKASTWLVWPRVHLLETTTANSPGDGDETVMSAHASQAGRPGATVRPYVQGDDLRTVHWPATAHRGEMMVRQFDPPAQPSTHVIVIGDVEQPGTDSSWEWLLSAAASLCADLEDHGLPVHASIGEVERDTLPGTLDALAEAGRCSGESLHPSQHPTMLFLHSTSSERPLPPRHVEARAYVAGPSAPEVGRAHV